MESQLSFLILLLHSVSCFVFGTQGGEYDQQHVPPSWRQPGPDPACFWAEEGGCSLWRFAEHHGIDGSKQVSDTENNF